MNKGNNTEPKLPLSVINHLDINIVFNKFGIVNLGAVMASTGVKMDKKVLRKLINDRFGNEFVGGIEFTDKDLED